MLVQCAPHDSAPAYRNASNRALARPSRLPRLARAPHASPRATTHSKVCSQCATTVGARRLASTTTHRLPPQDNALGGAIAVRYDSFATIQDTIISGCTAFGSEVRTTRGPPPVCCNAPTIHPPALLARPACPRHMFPPYSDPFPTALNVPPFGSPPLGLNYHLSSTPAVRRRCYICARLFIRCNPQFDHLRMQCHC